MPLLLRSWSKGSLVERCILSAHAHCCVYTSDGQFQCESIKGMKKTSDQRFFHVSENVTDSIAPHFRERVITTGSMAAGKLVIFWIFMYSPCYNIGYNALTYSKYRSRRESMTEWLTVRIAYLVELFPYAARSHGIAFFQFFGRGANFFRLVGHQAN